MAVGNQIRILTVDDHPVLREGIAAILASEADMVLVAEADNGGKGIARFRSVHGSTVLFPSYSYASVTLSGDSGTP